MPREPRLSFQTLLVLQAFLERPLGCLSGADIYNQTKIGSSTLYPILMRLEKAGWLESEWEDIDPKAAGRPRRHYYQLTKDGAAKARCALAQIQPSGQTTSEAWA